MVIPDGKSITNIQSLVDQIENGINVSTLKKILNDMVIDQKGITHIYNALKNNDNISFLLSNKSPNKYFKMKPTYIRKFIQFIIKTTLSDIISLTYQLSQSETNVFWYSGATDIQDFF